MSSFSRKKKRSSAPSTSSQVNQRPQLPANSQLQSPQEKQQSQPVYPWSAHAPPFGQLPSPFPRSGHALPMSATTAGELFLFGGYAYRSQSLSNDLYVVSTRDFSTTLLQTSGDVPSPRYGHRAVLSSTTLLIWGGADIGDQNAQNHSTDDSLYMLNLVSREWTRIVVDGPGPGGRCAHTMTLVGSKLFVFGGRTAERRLNDIWALDLNCLKSNPFWESYEPAPGNEKPLPRAAHVSVTTGDRIVIFGGRVGSHDESNDTWSFNISTRKWTELQCTGPIPSPRSRHAAALIDDVMYVFGGSIDDGTSLGDLTAFNLSTQRWTAFQDIGLSPCGMQSHAMSCDDTRVFVLGGKLSPDAQVDEAKLIHVLDTKLLIYPKPDSSSVNCSEKTTQLAQKLSAGQISSSDAGAAHGAFPFQMATSEDMGRPASPKSTLERQLSAMRAAQTERDRHIARLADQLVKKSALLEQAEANAAEEKKHAGLVQRELQTRLDELLMSRDQVLEQAQSALQKATFHAAEANERSQPANELETELAEVHAKLEASESELAVVRLRLTDAEGALAKSKAEAGTLRAQTAAGLVNTDVDRVMQRLMERMRSMEAEISSMKGNEKSIEWMECRNEG